MNINEHKTERARLVNEMRSMLDRAYAESRDLSGEEQSSWEKYESDISSHESAIKRLEDLSAREADIAASTREKSEKRERKVSDVVRMARGELRTADISFRESDVEDIQRRFSVRSGERRDLGRTTATDGAELVPTAFVRRLYEHLIENTAIREAGPTIVVTSDGNALNFPKTTAYSTAALFGEGVTITESDPQFATMTLDAFKYAALFQVSSELLQDEAVNLEEFLARQAGRAIANAAGAHFVTGDGSAKPNGVVTAATVGVTTAGTNVITTDELIDLYHSVLPGYRRNGVWMMDDATVTHIRKKVINSEAGNYVWQPGLQAGQPDTLLGRPVVVDTNVATIATGAKAIAFGDFSSYYIREVGNVRFDRSDDFDFDNDLATFRAIWRTDGDLIDTSAVKVLRLA